MSAVIVFGSIALLMACSVLSVVAGRVPHTPHHQRAFVWGVTALCAIPFWLAAMGAMLVGSFAGTHTGALLFLLVTTLLAVGSAVTAMIFAALAKRSGPSPNNSSKPTPLRGAA